MGRRYELSWRAAGCYCCHGVVCCDTQALLAASRGLCGAVRANGLGRRGRFADPALPWAMVFPQSGSLLPRHPSQIYQFLMEGLLLFVLLWLYAQKERKPGQVAAVFLMGYGTFRFIAEYFREPDAYLGILSMGMSMGQWLCVPMIVGGAAMWMWARQRNVA